MRLAALLLVSSVAALVAAGLPLSKPEDLRLPTELLGRIHSMLLQHIDKHDISGAVTLVARRGRIGHFETHGVMDLESGRVMQSDAVFWIASMSKPITAVAMLMMLEGGRLHLSDPVSTFIPSFRMMKSRRFGRART
jgi:CubicO group peptidase (beta-lactamase class C family)